MRYAVIREMDVVNAEGIACSVFFQGCLRHCPGCFNPETWDFDGGKEWTDEVADKFIELCQKPYIDCVSILGGEPFEQGDGLYHLLKRIKAEVGKPVYVWTGYTIEEIMDIPEFCKYFTDQLIDVLIDGSFEEDKRNLNLKLRGSSNQRIFDIYKA